MIRNFFIFLLKVFLDEYDLPGKNPHILRLDISNKLHKTAKCYLYSIKKKINETL